MKLSVHEKKSRVAAFGELMERVGMLTDRSSFLQQRCSGLGRMECHTLLLLEGFRQRKEEIRRSIADYALDADQVELYIPRNLRAEYEERKLSPEVLGSLPRDMSMKALAAEIGVACSRMTRIGDTLSDDVDPLTGKMRGKGFIHRESSPDDRRVILIHVTEEGSRKVQEQLSNKERITRLMLERIPREELDRVEEGLRTYLEAIESILPEIESGAEGTTGGDGDANNGNCR